MTLHFVAFDTSQPDVSEVSGFTIDPTTSHKTLDRDLTINGGSTYTYFVGLEPTGDLKIEGPLSMGSDVLTWTTGIEELTIRGLYVIDIAAKTLECNIPDGVDGQFMILKFTNWQTGGSLKVNATNWRAGITYMQMATAFDHIYLCFVDGAWEPISYLGSIV
jgi:hypothetical protein